MSIPYLPQETLDHIVDLLHDDPEALKACCLASKPWIPRTRMHLFAKVEFGSAEDFELWKKTFPDPSNSPAHHTHTMFVRCTPPVLMAGAWVGSLVQAFPHIMRLKLSWTTFHDNYNQRVTAGELEKISLTPFHRLSQTLKSLHMVFFFLPYPQILDLVRASPFLEDLALFGVNIPSGDGVNFHGPQTAVSLTPPPALTGCFDLHVDGGMGQPARQLLDLPGGLRFQKLALSWFEEGDLRWITKLVAKCTDTLKCIDLYCHLPSDSGPASVDLSNVTKLRDAVFRPQSPAVTWITAALQTINTKHRDLQHISIHAPSQFAHIDPGADIRQTIGEEVYRQWLDIDRLLVQFWESRSIRPEVICAVLRGENQTTRYYMRCLLPEITERGIIDLVYR